jgi:hypothetical protein
LYIDRGGPTYRLVHRIVTRWYSGPYMLQARIIAFWILTWMPMLLFALLEGRALGATPRESFLLDFSTYARFFLAVPMLILAEAVIGPRLRGAAMHFLDGKYIRPEDYPRFEQAVARVARWRESKLAELVIIALAFGGPWVFTAETVTGGAAQTWRNVLAPHTSLGVSMTGLWYYFVALPILQFFWYRWLWRMIVWCRFLIAISRLNLRLVATHADQAGGLGFLGTSHLSFGMLSFALAAVLSAEVAFMLTYEQAQIDAFKIEFLFFLIITEIVFFGPLLCFVPILIRTRLAWMRAYSMLVARYNRAFHDRWITGEETPDATLLGSADIQSLADLGSSFEYIRSMKIVPLSPRVIIQLALVTTLPCLPLLLLVFPVGRIIDLVAGAVF